MKLISKSEKETSRIAQKVVKQVLALRHFKHAAVVALVGDLGAGKTTFAKSFAKALGVRGRVLSPTFILMRKHEIRSTKSEANNNFQKVVNGALKFKNLYHVDAYRINDIKELAALEFKKILDNPDNIVLIEWADKIKEVLPKDALWLEFMHGKTAHERTIAIKD